MTGIRLYRKPEGFAHGTRARYVAGRCRCEPCRKANRDYAALRERARAQGDTGELIDASPVRAHLAALSSQGVGRRAVAAACDVALSVVRSVGQGRKLRIRASTARRILAVDAGAIADRGLVLAGPTRAALRELLRYGLTQTEVAARLGSKAKTPALQLKTRHVTAKSAQRVQRLLAEVRAEVALEREVGVICSSCGESHAIARRLEWLRHHPGIEAVDAAELKSCWWGGGRGGYSMLLRDRAMVRSEARAA